jgi:hypothetical protein
MEVAAEAQFNRLDNAANGHLEEEDLMAETRLQKLRKNG